mgnify:CR=1 FL=1
MKKIMMIAAMMVVAVSANAQFEPGTFSIQPKIGANVSWLSNNPGIEVAGKSITGKTVTLDNAPKAGFVIGAEAEFQLAKMFSLAAGVNYSLQGGGWDDYEEKADNYKYEVKDFKVSLGYVTVPVVANIYLFKGFAVKGGVQFGFMTNADLEYSIKNDIDGHKSTEKYSIDYKDDLKKVDISIPIGVSYQVPTIPVVIDGRFNLGLSRINKDKDYGEKDVKNQVVQVTVGYKFKL